MPDEPTHKQTYGDFILTIAVVDATLQCGNDIKIETVFENLSGKRYDIIRSPRMTVPFVVKSEFYSGTFVMSALICILEIDEIIKEDWQVGSKLPKGQHELVATASFYILQTESEQIAPSETVKVVSNTIILTVK